MAEGDFHTSHLPVGCLGAQTEQGPPLLGATEPLLPWQRSELKGLFRHIWSDQEKRGVREKKDLRQCDDGAAHKATVAPGLRQAAAEDQNRGMSNQWALRISDQGHLVASKTRTAIPDVKRSTWLPGSRNGPFMSSALPTLKSMVLPLAVSPGEAALRALAVLIISGLGSMPKALSKYLASGLVELPGPHPTSNKTFIAPPLDL